jgi:hypothetical protein
MKNKMASTSIIEWKNENIERMRNKIWFYMLSVLEKQAEIMKKNGQTIYIHPSPTKRWQKCSSSSRLNVE